MKVVIAVTLALACMLLANSFVDAKRGGKKKKCDKLENKINKTIEKFTEKLVDSCGEDGLADFDETFEMEYDESKDEGKRCPKGDRG